MENNNLTAKPTIEPQPTSGADTLKAMRERFAALTSDWSNVTYEQYRGEIVPLHREIVREAEAQGVTLGASDALSPPQAFLDRDAQEQARIYKMVDEFKVMTADWSKVTVGQYKDQILPQYVAIKTELGKLNMEPPVGFGMNAPEDYAEKIAAIENGTVNPDRSMLLSQVVVPSAGGNETKPKEEPPLVTGTTGTEKDVKTTVQPLGGIKTVDWLKRISDGTADAKNLGQAIRKAIESIRFHAKGASTQQQIDSLKRAQQMLSKQAGDLNQSLRFLDSSGLRAGAPTLDKIKSKIETRLKSITSKS